MKIALLLIAVIAVAGCATPQTQGPSIAASAVAEEAAMQQRYMIEQRVAERIRVARVHRRLSVANLEFCQKTTPSVGAGLHSLSRYGRRFKDAAKTAGITEAAMVAYVLEDTPAARAGLRAGDTLLAINDEKFDAGPQALRRAERQLQKLDVNAPANFTIKRNGEVLALQMQAEVACGYPIQIAEGDEVNAYADGNTVIIARGMLRFLQNDDELALILGHELAHNAMGHLDAQMQNQMVGMAGGLVLDVLLAATTGYASDTFSRAGAQAGALAYSKEFENEADYAGLYFMTRAGFDTSGVANFWRRMAAEAPQAIFVGQSHPTTPERFVAIATARNEIQLKQAAQLPLRPRMKSDPQESAIVIAPPIAPASGMPAEAAVSTGSEDAATKVPAGAPAPADGAPQLPVPEPVMSAAPN